jgi:transposase
VLADLARGRLRAKRTELERALQGQMTSAQRFVLTELLNQVEGLDESIVRFDRQIEAACVPFEHAVAHLDTIPGVARTTAEVIVAEIGTDMSRFPTPGHLAAWAGVCPGNNESAGKRLSGRVRQGNLALRSALVQAAWAASHSRDTYLAAQYHRLAGRRGKKRALLAVAHSIAVIAYCLIARDQDYTELGGNYFDQRRPQSTVRHLTTRLKQLGYDVTLNPSGQEAA